jgi:cell division protein FtsL
MFQEEVKTDDRTSSMTPMLLIAAICLTIVGTAVYVVHEARKGMSDAEAKRAVTAMLEKRGPALVLFVPGW